MFSMYSVLDYTIDGLMEVKLRDRWFDLPPNRKR